jgi:hypothetical protein
MVSIPGTGLRVHLLTVAGLPVTVLVVGVAWLAVGAVVVGPLPEPTPGTIGSVTAATVGVFLTTGATTVRTYFLNGAYRDHNARTAFGGLFTKMGIVFFASMLTFVTVGAATAGPDAELTAIDPTTVGGPLLLVIVALTFTSEYLSAYHDRLKVYFRSYHPRYGWQQPPPDPEPVGHSLDDASRTLRPCRWARVFGGPFRVTRHPGVALLGVAGIGGGVLGWLGGRQIGAIAVAGLSLAVVAVLLCLDQVLRYGTVEYRIGRDAGAVVAYDRLSESPLWRLDAAETEVTRPERTVLDTLLGTATVRLEHDDGEHTIPHVSDPDPVVEALASSPGSAGRADDSERPS